MHCLVWQSQSNCHECMYSVLLKEMDDEFASSWVETHLQVQVQYDVNAVLRNSAKVGMESALPVSCTHYSVIGPPARQELGRCRITCS